MRLSHEIDIDQPPEAVFFWLGDPARAMRWTSSVSKTEILHRTDDWVGTTFRETVADETGSTELAGVVTAWSPNQLIAFRLQGQYNNVEVEYRLERLEQRTRLSMRADVRFKGLLKVTSWLFWPLFEKKALREFAEDCRRLKTLCEDHSAKPTP